jgi:hypothetical protein
MVSPELVPYIAVHSDRSEQSPDFFPDNGKQGYG